MTIVREPSFVLSAMNCEQLGVADRPEVAFIGRSNVGKSSLLGIVMQRPSMVKVSRTPGRTRALNLFLLEAERDQVRRDLRFVDLPGYGYAKLNKTDRAKMSEILSEYLAEREGVSAVCQLVDARHDPTREDREVYQGLVEQAYEVILVATKADKLPVSKRKAAVRGIAKAMGAPEPITFSVPSKIGHEPLWKRIWAATEVRE